MKKYFIILFFISIFIPLSCLAKNFDMTEQYWEEAQTQIKIGNLLEAAQLVEKAVFAEQ
jgi:hypothetical protein